MDEFLLCAIRDCVTDSPVSPTTRARMLLLLERLKVQDDTVRALLKNEFAQLSPSARTVLEYSVSQVGSA